MMDPAPRQQTNFVKNAIDTFLVWLSKQNRVINVGKNHKNEDKTVS